MEIEIVVKTMDTGNIHKEYYDIADGVDPQEYAEGLIQYYNITLRPTESPRRLVSVRIIERG